MDPAYTTIQPHRLYPVGSLAMDYNARASQYQARPAIGVPTGRPMQGFGRVGFGDVDVRPHLTLYPPGGAVSIVVDPTSALSGNVLLPTVGAVPYDIDLLSMSVVLHLPLYGDVAIPVAGGGGGNAVNVPGLGDVPYEVTLGPPMIPADAYFSAAGMLSGILPVVLLAVGGWLLIRATR